MSNVKTTLTDAQPGGRVRLGDQAERARFEAWAGEFYHLQHMGEKYRSAITTDAWQAWQAALSAQPSPGCQGDWRAMLSQFGEDDPREGSRSNGHDGVDHNDWVDHVEVPVDVLVRIAIALSARQPVGEIPAGFVLVPEKFGIPAEVWEGVEFVIGGPGTGEGEAYLDSTAWVGDLIQDDGSAVYGLHLSCDECPEEGSVTLSVFTARAEVQP